MIKCVNIVTVCPRKLIPAMQAHGDFNNNCNLSWSFCFDKKNAKKNTSKWYSLLERVLDLLLQKKFIHALCICKKKAVLFWFFLGTKIICLISSDIAYHDELKAKGAQYRIYQKSISYRFNLFFENWFENFQHSNKS